MERLLAGHYRAVWGFCGKEKERAVTGGLGPSRLTLGTHRPRVIQTFFSAISDVVVKLCQSGYIHMIYIYHIHS